MMPADVLPLYSIGIKWSHKVELIVEVVLESGNFGHKRKRSRSKNFWVGSLYRLTPI